MLLKELSEAIGISGKEDAVRKIIVDALRDHVDDLKIDPMGSVIAFKKGTAENPLRVLVAAHMDEVGFMVTGYDGDGLLHFAAVGGIDDRILPGLRVKVGDNALNGVVTWTPIHQNRDQNVVKIQNLRIDIGASSKDEAAGKVKRGERIAFDSRFMELSSGVIRGKALDDRAGCAMLLDVLMAGPYPVDLYAAFTVQEEIGLRGAQVAAQAVNPDVAFVLENTTANDLPNPVRQPDDEQDINPTCFMLGGPVISFIDRSMITHPKLFAFMRDTAVANEIPFQYKTTPGGGTDGGAIHTANGGARTGVISLPCRYIHSPSTYLNQQDYDNGLRLAKALLQSITPEILA